MISLPQDSSVEALVLIRSSEKVHFSRVDGGTYRGCPIEAQESLVGIVSEWLTGLLWFVRYAVLAADIGYL